MSMTIEAAQAWIKAPGNRSEFERLVRIGYPPACKANEAWWAAKAAWDARSSEYPRLRDYWLDCFNEFLVIELTMSGRAELRGRYDYKVSDFGVIQK